MTRTETASETAFEAPSKEESESFGTWLRRQRELREITLREIADTSKISLRYLQALEDDRFDILPAPVFAKGFLRQYARYVGLDPEETVNFYLSAVGQANEEPEEEPSPRRPKTVGTWSYALAVLVVAILLMIVVWTLLRLNRDSEDAPAEAGAVAEDPAASSTASPDTAVEPAPAESPDRAAGPETETDAAAPAAAEVPLLVTLDFRGDCWVRATVDGAAREDRVYTQGESLQLGASELVELELGNARTVDVEVNGHPMELEDESSNPVRRLSIDRETAAALDRGVAR